MPRLPFRSFMSNRKPYAITFLAAFVSMLTLAVAADAPKSAEPTGHGGVPPTEKTAKTQQERYGEKTKKKEEERKAEPPAATQALLEPTYDVAWAEAEKAIEQYKVASGLKLTVFAAEPQLANPVALSIDDKGKLWV